VSSQRKGPKPSGSKWLPGPIAARSGAAVNASASEPCLVAWEARRSLGPASPANMSKRGLFTRLYAPYQTLILVKARLPKENPVSGNGGNPRPWTAANPPFHAGKSKPQGIRPARGRTRRRAMTTETRHRILAARPRPSRAQGKPGARRASRVKQVEHTSLKHHRSAGYTRPSLRNGFNGFLRALPGDRACLPPSSRGNNSAKLDASVGPSGPHDFAVRACLARLRRNRVHRIRAQRS
jgi:hypothetical protein